MPDWLSRRLTLSDEALDTLVGDELVILHLGNDTYYGIDALGTQIWTMLKEGGRLLEIRDHLVAEYNVAPEQIEADMKRFVEDLLTHGLLIDA